MCSALGDAADHISQVTNWLYQVRIPPAVSLPTVSPFNLGHFDGDLGISNCGLNVHLPLDVYNLLICLLILLILNSCLPIKF